MTNLLKEVAVKPGEARRMGREPERSMCRRRVSRRVWKNFSRPWRTFPLMFMLHFFDHGMEHWCPV